MKGIVPRLLSRFKWGLAADLQKPDLETRIAILKKHLYNDGIEIPDDVIEYLAYSISTNVRELEGALISIVAQSSLNKKPITIDLAKEMVKKFVKNTTKEISIDYIQKLFSNILIYLFHLLILKQEREKLYKLVNLQCFSLKIY